MAKKEKSKPIELYLPINNINDFIDMIGKKKSVYVGYYTSLYYDSFRRFPADVVAHWQLIKVLNLIKDNKLYVKYERTNRQNS